MVGLGVVLVLVDAEDDGEVIVGGRRGDDDFLDRALQVSLGLGGISEVAGGFNDDLCADRGPVELCGIALGEDLDLLAVDGDVVIAGSDFVRQVAENGVVLEQMRQGLGRGEVVDGDKFEFGIAKRSAENVTADAAESVDAYLHSHLNKVSSGVGWEVSRSQHAHADETAIFTVSFLDASTMYENGCEFAQLLRQRRDPCTIHADR